eukprot:Nk52_evm27s2340 gene=Nk52_evmTU27s2340
MKNQKQKLLRKERRGRKEGRPGEIHDEHWEEKRTRTRNGGRGGRDDDERFTRTNIFTVQRLKRKGLDGEQREPSRGFRGGACLLWALFSMCVYVLMRGGAIGSGMLQGVSAGRVPILVAHDSDSNPGADPLPVPAPGPNAGPGRSTIHGHRPGPGYLPVLGPQAIQGGVGGGDMGIPLPPMRVPPAPVAPGSGAEDSEEWDVGTVSMGRFDEVCPVPRVWADAPRERQLTLLAANGQKIAHEAIPYEVEAGVAGSHSFNTYASYSQYNSGGNRKFTHQPAKNTGHRQSWKNVPPSNYTVRKNSKGMWVVPLGGMFGKNANISDDLDQISIAATIGYFCSAWTIGNSSRLFGNVSFELYSGETKYDSSNAVLMAENMVTENNVVGIVGPMLSGTAESVGSVGSLWNLIMVSYSAGSAVLGMNRRYFPSFYRTIPSIDQDAGMLGALCCYFGWTSVVLLQAASIPFPDALNLQGGHICDLTVKGTLTIYEDSEWSYKNVLTSLSQIDANIILATSLTGDPVKFLELAEERGFTSGQYQWLTLVGLNNNVMSHQESLKEWQGLLTLSGYFEENEQEKLFEECIRNNSNNFEHAQWMIDHFERKSMIENGYYAWDSVLVFGTALNHVLTQMVNEGNITDEVNLTTLRDKIYEVVPELTYRGVSGEFSFVKAQGNRFPEHVLTNIVPGKDGNILEERRVAYIKRVNLESENATVEPQEDFYFMNNHYVDKDYFWKPIDVKDHIPYVPLSYHCEPCVHGMCIPKRRCKCDENWTGDLCDELMYVAWDSPSSIGILCVIGVVNLLAVVCFTLVIVYREDSAMKSASPVFCCLMITGVIIVVSFLLTYIGKNSVWKCHLRIWGVVIGLCFIFANLLSKTYRIHRIFNNQTVTKALKLSDFDLFKLSLWMATPVLITLIIYSGMGDVKVGIGGPADERKYVCDTNEAVGLFVKIFLISYLMIILLASSYMSFKTRNVSNRYNEARSIAYCVFISLFAFILWICLTFLLNIGISSEYIVNNLTILVTMIIILFVMFGPKFHEIWIRGSKTHVRAQARTNTLSDHKGSTLDRNGVTMAGPGNGSCEYELAERAHDRGPSSPLRHSGIVEESDDDSGTLDEHAKSNGTDTSYSETEDSSVNQ